MLKIKVDEYASEAEVFQADRNQGVLYPHFGSEEVADRIGVTSKTIRNLILSGKIHYAFKLGWNYRIPYAGLAAYLGVREACFLFGTEQDKNRMRMRGDMRGWMLRGLGENVNSIIHSLCFDLGGPLGLSNEQLTKIGKDLYFLASSIFLEIERNNAMEKYLGACYRDDPLAEEKTGDLIHVERGHDHDAGLLRWLKNEKKARAAKVIHLPAQKGE